MILFIKKEIFEKSIFFLELDNSDIIYVQLTLIFLILFVDSNITLKNENVINKVMHIKFLFEMKYLYKYIVESKANNLFKNSPCHNMAATMG